MFGFSQIPSINGDASVSRPANIVLLTNTGAKWSSSDHRGQDRFILLCFKSERDFEESAEYQALAQRLIQSDSSQCYLVFAQAHSKSNNHLSVPDADVKEYLAM